jgi:hypothetical protein
MKQQLKFIQEYIPDKDLEFSPYQPDKTEGKHPVKRWIEIQFHAPEGRGTYIYMEIRLLQENQWEEFQTETMVIFKKETIELHKTEYYAFGPQNQGLSIAEMHLINALASGSFLGSHACSAVHTLLLKVMCKIERDTWIKYLPGEIKYRDFIKYRDSINSIL